MGMKWLLVVLIFSSFVFSNQVSMKEMGVFVDGFRIQIEVKVKDPLGVSDGRIYFKNSSEGTYYYFAPMKCVEKKCIGTLPLTQKDLKNLDYFILYQNNGGNIYKTKELSMSKANKLTLPSWQTKDLESRVVIKTEYSKIPNSLFGFKDYVRVEKVPIEEKLGLISEIYEGNIAGKANKDLVEGIYEGEVELSFELSDYFKDLFSFSLIDAGIIVVGVVAASAVFPGLIPFL